MTGPAARRAVVPVLVLLPALAVVAALAVGPARPAAAQPPTAAPVEEELPHDPPTLALRDVDAVLAADDPAAEVRATLVIGSDAARTDLRLVTTAYARVEGRDALRAAAEGDLGAVFAAQSDPLPDLAPGASQVIGTATDRQALSLVGDDRAGVYPLRYQVFEGPDPVASILTWAVVLPEAGPAPLPATTVLHLADAGVPPLDGDIAAPAVDRALAADGPLRRTARDLRDVAADGSAAGTALVVDGRLLEDLSALAGGWTRPDGTTVGPGDRAARRAGEVLDSLRRTAARADTEVLAVPYGPADVVALVRGGRGADVRELLVIGAERAEAVLGTAPTRGIVVPPDGLDAQSLAALGPVQADAVLMDARYLAFAEDEAMEPVRRLRTADGGEVRLLVPDADLSAVLADPRHDGEAAVVQRLLAETALAWLEGAGAPASSHGVLVSTAPLGGASPVSAAAVGDAVSAAPWLRPVSLSTLADRVRPADRVVRLAYPPRSAASELDPGYVARLAQARAALGPLEVLLPEGDPTSAAHAERLLAAASTSYRDPAHAAAGRARIDEVLGSLAAVEGHVEVVSSAPVTLTAATGEVPVTLVNSGDVAVRVRATLSSTRFDFPEGGQVDLTLQPRSSAQLRVPARALNPGGFAAITVTVTDPDGAQVLTQTRISVRSTAVPVVGLIAIAGSALVLATWGIRQSLRRRRQTGRGTGARDRRAPAA